MSVGVFSHCYEKLRIELRWRHHPVCVVVQEAKGIPAFQSPEKWHCCSPREAPCAHVFRDCPPTPRVNSVLSCSMTQFFHLPHPIPAPFPNLSSEQNLPENVCKGVSWVNGWVSPFACGVGRVCVSTFHGRCLRRRAGRLGGDGSDMRSPEEKPSFW